MWIQQKEISGKKLGRFTAGWDQIMEGYVETVRYVF
jgi:hypothetical protein